MKTILVDAVNTFILKDEGMNVEMHDLLESYSQKKLIVTNADDGQIITFGLDKVQYEVFTMKHNPDKPDPEYFKSLMQTYGVSAADLVYFEHNPEAVKSAQSVGITSYWYDPEKKDLAALKEFLDRELV